MSTTFYFIDKMKDFQDHQLPLLNRHLRHLRRNLEFTAPLSKKEIYGTKKTGSSESSSSIFLRLLFVVFIGCISLWASNEANKGFQITILNETRDYSPANRKFQLLYVSNDRATRLVLEASQFIESLLYPKHLGVNSSQNYGKKQVNHVTVRLACQNLTQLVSVDNEEGKYVLNLDLAIMYETNSKDTMFRAVVQGMAWVWIFDNCQNAPRFLINGLVDYISSKLVPISAEVDSDRYLHKTGHDYICWKNENPKAVASFLSYCEERREGFIQRLNQAIRENSIWHDGVVDDALGMPVQQICSSFMSRELLLSSSLDSSPRTLL